jgi:hypothetical protein
MMHNNINGILTQNHSIFLSSTASRCIDYKKELFLAQ